ncbi:MAG: RidA family protein [Rhodospirillales bacterium]
MIDAFNPAGIWQPFGAFSMGVIQGKGQIVYLKGQLALDRDGNVVGKGDMRAQVRKTLDNIEAALKSVGGKMGDIVSLVQHTTDISRFMQASDVRKAYFNAPYPVTTTIEVARLFHRELLVEITAIAEIPRARFKRPSKRA